MVHQGIKSPKKKAITIRYDPYSNQRNGLKSQAKRKTSSSIGRLVSISKGDTRKRSSDSLCESNKLISNSVNNLTTVDVNCNNSSHRRGLPTEPCCLCCGPGIKATKNRKHTRSDQRFDGSRKNLSSLKDVHDDDSVQAERYVPSQELYKKLIKEHLQLESSFKLLCQRLEEERERSVSESQEKQLLKEQVNNLTRKVDVLSLELQEARDQNELMEFRILESEQCQAKAALAESQIKCDKAIQLENQPSNELRNEQSKPGTMGSDLLEFVKRFPTLDTPTSATILASTATKSTKSVSSLESYTLTLSLTSEDEGLGDDGRRDQFSGPSSLSDIQMSDEESNGSGRRSKVSEAGVQTLNETMLTPLGPCKCCSKQSELESEISRLIEERDNLREQVLELEEAENDARLVSQRLQRQVENLVNQVDCLQISLVNANQQIEQSNETIRSLREDELKLKVDFMMALIAKHEESPSRLVEELKAKLKEKKSELASLEPLMLSSFNYDDRSADHGSLTRHNFKQAVYAQQQQQQQQQQLQQQQQQQQQQLQQQQQQQKNYQAAQLSQYQQYYQSSYADSNDCEIFIPEDSLPPDPGSSFHVQMIDSARYNRRSSNRSPLPICETVKPKKIDVLLSTSLTSSSSSPSSILPSSSASSSSPSPSLSPSSSPSSSPLISPSSSSSSSSSGDQEK